MASEAGRVVLIFRSGAKQELYVTDIAEFLGYTTEMLEKTRDGNVQVACLIGPNGEPGKGSWFIVSELAAILRVP